MGLCRCFVYLSFCTAACMAGYAVERRYGSYLGFHGIPLDPFHVRVMEETSRLHCCTVGVQ